MIDQLTTDRILDAAKIEDVVSDFVTLHRRGVNLVGLCPFHEDKSPSFYVSPAKNICKCFACGEGGTAVHFIMKHEQLGYHDALRYLARKYHIEVQERELSDEEKRIQGDRESMFIVNGWAQQYFTTQLFEHEEGKSVGLRYFSERGFRENTVRKFQLGYSLEQRDALYQAATSGGYRKEYLEKTGLIIPYENGRVNDRFRGRVIFPVHSLSGKVVAFGGRTLKKDDKTAKYVNSPESEIYHKSNELYGIFFAKIPIQKADRCYLVEGYTDVISMHQAGIENVVASSGTALTGGQIRLIKRFTNNITVLYDGDTAGIKAALRGIDMLLEEGMNVKVLLLPDGEDPDSFARKHNASGFKEYIKDNEVDFIRFKTKLLLEEAGDDPIKRSSLISDIIRSIAIIPDNIVRTIYIKETGNMMGVDEAVILNEVNKLRIKKIEKPQRTPTGTAAFQAGSPTPPPPGFPDITAATHPVDGEHPYAPGNIPPPMPDDFPMEGEGTRPSPVSEKQGKSPYDANELNLLRYIIRYGEKVIFDEEEIKEIREGNKVVGRIVVHDPSLIRVAGYIYDEITQDGLALSNPVYQLIMEEAKGLCATEGISLSRRFLYHPNVDVSKLAAELVSDKYVLSKYHTKHLEAKKSEETETEAEDEKNGAKSHIRALFAGGQQEEMEKLKLRLEVGIVYELRALKKAYVVNQINELNAKLKEAQTNKDVKQEQELQAGLARLQQKKSLLCKEVGEQIVLKM